MDFMGAAPEPKGDRDDPRLDLILPPAPVDPLLEQILADKVLLYRCERLVKAGMTIPQARKLAVDNRVDLHFVIERLINRGCPIDTAFDIASYA
jgi:hypothetical protein